jgi:hypothetical protein
MLGVQYREKIDSPYIQYVLSLGLEVIWDVITAESYQDRYQLLESKGCPSKMDVFLYGALWQVNVWREYQHPAEDPESAHVPRALSRELDAGPKQAWLWAHRDPDNRAWIYARPWHYDRQWGYVLWDKSRIEAVGLLESPWTAPGPSADMFIDREEDQQERTRMQNSWDQRAKVWSSGGRGWWSWEDESRVEWVQDRDSV